MLVVPQLARAQAPQPDPVRLEYRADKSCPEEPFFRDVVATGKLVERTLSERICTSLVETMGTVVSASWLFPTVLPKAQEPAPQAPAEAPKPEPETPKPPVAEESKVPEPAVPKPRIERPVRPRVRPASAGRSSLTRLRSISRAPT